MPRASEARKKRKRLGGKALGGRPKTEITPLQKEKIIQMAALDRKYSDIAELTGVYDLAAA